MTLDFFQKVSQDKAFAERLSKQVRRRFSRNLSDGVRDILPVNGLRIGHHGRLEKRVIKLSDVARPRVLPHKRHGGTRNLFVDIPRFFVLKVVVNLLEEMVNKQRNIFSAFSERGQLDRYRRNPIVEVIAELVAGNGICQIAVRRRNDANIAGRWFGLADSKESAAARIVVWRLENPEQLCLHCRVALTDFIRK